MPIDVRCHCGRRLRARDEFAGARARCPSCGQTIQLPAAAGDAYSGAPRPAAASGSRAGPTNPAQGALVIKDFFDPPSAPAASPRDPGPPVLRRMFEALLDPRSIQWMLMLGGGLAVLGLVIWLVSLGVFEDPRVLAVLLGIGTLAILGAGWAVVLRTKYRTAGTALTFLGCVLAPLNLWFYHAQDLITLEDHLWVGGVVCCLLYAATLYVLRDPLFMYAFEGGVTLTMVLLLAEFSRNGDRSVLSLFFLGLGLISLHAERAFPPEAPEFRRERYGLPLFWSGQAQVGVGLLILLGSQLLEFFAEPLARWLGARLQTNLLTENHLLAGTLWLAGVYAYLYSDLVRRVGVFTCLAAACLVMAELTLLRLIPTDEVALLAAGALALSGLAVNLLHRFVASPFEKLNRAVPAIALSFSAVPLLIGWVLDVRATSAAVRAMNWSYETGWLFVVVMLIVAAGNRISVWVYRRESPWQAAAYLFFSAAGLILAVAGFLRTPAVGLTEWYQQAPILMLLPIAYIVGARFWRGAPEERPLEWVSHTAAAIILLHTLFGSLEVGSLESIGTIFRPLTGRIENLLVALVFAEATVFYTLAGLFCRRGFNAYLAAAAACGALWQCLGYFDVPETWHTMLFAILGAAALIAARSLGLEQVTVYRAGGEQRLATRGRGLAAFQSGNAILTVALLSAFLHGLAELATRSRDEALWSRALALGLTAVASLVAAGIARSVPWRRWYATASIALAVLIILTLSVEWLQRLTFWQKMEVVLVVIGAALLIVSHVGRFRETQGEINDAVSFGLLLGSCFVTLPLLVAVFYHRLAGAGPSTIDDLGLIGVTLLLLVTGVGWQIRATTLLGGASLTLYLLLVIVSLARMQQVAVGVYLAVGGAIVFALGVALSIYRDRLLELPDRIARREGVFRIISWR